jgi:hypothetical protein
MSCSRQFGPTQNVRITLNAKAALIKEMFGEEIEELAMTVA